MSSTRSNEEILTLKTLRSELRKLADEFKTEITQMSSMLKDDLTRPASPRKRMSRVSTTSVLSSETGVHKQRYSANWGRPRNSNWARLDQSQQGQLGMPGLRNAPDTSKFSSTGQQGSVGSTEAYWDISEVLPLVPLSIDTESFFGQALNTKQPDSCRELVRNGTKKRTIFTEMRSFDHADKDAEMLEVLQPQGHGTADHAQIETKESKTAVQKGDSHAEGEGVLSQWAHSKVFIDTVCLVIVMNAICVGVEAHYNAVNWTAEAPEIFHTFERGFCVFFLMEILFRVCAEGCFKFFCSASRAEVLWNIFDLTVVCMQIASEAIRHVPHHQTLRLWRNLRLVRLIRIIRLHSVLGTINELQMLTVCIQHALKSLGWVMILLMVMIYIVAVFLTQEVTNLKIRPTFSKSLEGSERLLEGSSIEKVPTEEEAKSLAELFEMFGSVDRSMLSLYAMIADGIHWEELMKPLAEFISPWMRLLFCCYSAVALFAVMNAVTGVFVESAMYSASEDKKRGIARQLQKVLHSADDDGSGDISWEEFKMQIETAEVKAALDAVELEPEDAKELFRLIDMDASGSVDVNELMRGCYRLMGQAKAIDLASLMHAFTDFTSHHQKHVAYVEECMVELLGRASQ